MSVVPAGGRETNCPRGFPESPRLATADVVLVEVHEFFVAQAGQEEKRLAVRRPVDEFRAPLRRVVGVDVLGARPLAVRQVEVGELVTPRIRGEDESVRRGRERGAVEKPLDVGELGCRAAGGRLHPDVGASPPRRFGRRPTCRRGRRSRRRGAGFRGTGPGEPAPVARGRPRRPRPWTLERPGPWQRPAQAWRRHIRGCRRARGRKSSAWTFLQSGAAAEA